MRRLARWSVLMLPALLLSRGAAAQGPTADPADVATLRGILHAWYDVISGPAGAPRQWRRDSALYTAGATFVAMEMRNGKPVATHFTPEQFRQAVNASFVANGFFESETGSRIERFGNLAQVRSVYEARRTADGPVISRGVNYLLLFWDGTRWWISGAVWEDERAGTPLPAEWIGRHEVAP